MTLKIPTKAALEERMKSRDGGWPLHRRKYRKLYIAAPSAYIHEARRLRGLAQSLGWRLSYDWMRDMDARAEAGLWDTDLTEEEAYKAAFLDFRGVAEADRVVFWIPPERRETAMWTELGIAAAAVTYPEHRLKFIMNGHEHDDQPWKRHIFFALFPSQCFVKTAEEALYRPQKSL